MKRKQLISITLVHSYGSNRTRVRFNRRNRGFRVYVPTPSRIEWFDRHIDGILSRFDTACTVYVSPYHIQIRVLFARGKAG